MRRCDAAIAVAAMVFSLAACSSASPTGPTGANTSVGLTAVADSPEWRASTPEAERVDEARLADLVRRIRRGEYGDINSLLIVRDERLIVEEYFNGWTAAAVHTQQSVSKSVTSLAAGAAIEAGRLRLSDEILPYFADYEPIGALDANKQALTVRDLLMMRGGFDWSEQVYAGSPLQRLNECQCDWIRFVLDWRMRDAPGTRWEYVSGGVILLGAAIGRATGERVDLFLERALFSPLGIEGARWTTGRPDGLPHTGGGLFLRPRDMAKIGTLIVTGGIWNGRRVISESWLRESTQSWTPAVRTFASQPASYGYLWWGLPGGVVAAAGARGQWILAVPGERLTVVSTAENGESGWTAPVQFLYSHILPALR